MQNNVEAKISIDRKITPFLWFDNNAEAAVNLYTSLFENSTINNVVRYNSEMANAARMPDGGVLTIDFTLDGQNFVAMNAGPVFKFTEAVSFVINCDDQQEVDKFWNNLTANGGQESQCGWLKDQFGLSWQVIPKVLLKALNDKDAARSQRALHAMLQMKKIIVADIEKAMHG